jgi:DNA-binding winged helix-turn-helix (wHTH) protein/tetratricopeptide (TPR) repeat protein
VTNGATVSSIAIPPTSGYTGSVTDNTVNERPAGVDGTGEIELRSGAVRVLPASRELEVAGSPVTIERRAFDLLVHLMRNADRVVDKDELLREVWHSRPVSESTVAQAVSRVRRALGGETEEWVATAYGVGYRFTGRVEQLGPSPSEVADPEGGEALSPPRAGIASRRSIGVLALGVVLMAMLVAAWISVQPPDESELRIAVLPVQNETGDARLDWVELGVLPLIDRTIEDAGVRRVDAGQVLSTIRRYPDADDPATQASVITLNTGADRVLVPRLYVADNGFRLEVSRADGATEVADITLQGGDIPVLAVAAGQTLSGSRSRWEAAGRAQRELVTDDPFVNEAFARGLDARLRGQWEEAARFFDTVLTAAPDLLDAKYHLALVTRRLGDWDYTEQLHEELLEAARERGDIGMQASVQLAAGTLAWRRGDRDEAEVLYSQALDIFRELGNADSVANALANLGILAQTRAEYSLAEERMGQALAHYRAVGDRFNEARALANLGRFLTEDGRLDEATDLLQQSLEIRRTLELPLLVSQTLSALADVDMERGNWQQALVHYEDMLALAREYDSPTLEAAAAGDLSTVLRRLGRLDEARRAAADSYRVAVELGNRSSQAYALLQQGRAEHDFGHWQRSIDLFEQSRAIYVEIDQPLHVELARVAQAESLTEAGRYEEAAVLLDTAVRQYEAEDLEFIGRGLARAQARLAQLSGDLDAALAAQRRAYRMAVERGSLLGPLDYGGELGLLLIETGADPAELDSLAAELEPRAEVSASALAFLARYHRDRDPARALTAAERRRRLIGDGWTPADERELQELRARSAGVR